MPPLLPAKLLVVTTTNLVQLDEIFMQVALLNTSLPVPLLEQGTFADSLISKGQWEHLWCPLTPHTTCQSDPITQSCVVRGVPANKIKR